MDQGWVGTRLRKEEHGRRRIRGRVRDGPHRPIGAHDDIGHRAGVEPVDDQRASLGRPASDDPAEAESAPSSR